MPLTLVLLSKEKGPRLKEKQCNLYNIDAMDN